MSPKTLLIGSILKSAICHKRFAIGERKVSSNGTYQKTEAKFQIPSVIRKAIFVLLSLLLLTACGGQDQDPETGDYVYAGQPLQTGDLFEGIWISSNNFHVTKDYLYFMTDAFYRIPITDKPDFSEIETVVSGEDIYRAEAGKDLIWSSISCFTVDEKNNLYYSIVSYGDNSIILTKCSEDGMRIYQNVVMQGNDVSSSSLSILAADDSGNAYILLENILRRFDAEGNLTGELVLDEEWGNRSLFKIQLLELPEGQICLYADSYLDASRKVYKILEGSVPRLEALEGLSENISMSSDLYQGLNGPLINEFDGWLYQYQITDGSRKAVLRWEDVDIFKNYLCTVVQVTEDWLLVAENNGPLNDPENILTLLVRTPADEVPKKEQITLASLFPSSDLQEAVVMFNRSSDRYHVTIDSYGAKRFTNNNDDNEGAYIRLDSSLASKDNTPDLLDLSDLDITKYAAIGALEDLGPYIEKSGSVQKKDYLNNLLEGYTIDGKLVCIPKAFYFMGAWVMDERVWEAEDWSLEALIAVTDKYEDLRLFPEDWDDPEVILRLFLSRYILDKFIDQKSGECLLDSEEFCNLLSWVKEQAAQKSDAQNSLLSPQMVNSFEDYHRTLVDSGNQAVLQGLPSADGQMAYSVSVDNVLGMAANSHNKQAAWEFLEFFLQREKADPRSSIYTYRFPTKIAVLDQIEEDIVTPNYLEIDGKIRTDENGDPIIMPRKTIYSMGICYEYYHMEQSDADTLRELLESLDFTPQSSMESSIISIITEEAGSFFRGDKSAEQAAEIIQNRVRMLILENQ